MIPVRTTVFEFVEEAEDPVYTWIRCTLALQVFKNVQLKSVVPLPKGVCRENFERDMLLRSRGCVCKIFEPRFLPKKKKKAYL